MKMTLVSTTINIFVRVVHVTESPVQSVLLLVYGTQRSVLLHRHVNLFQHAVTFDQEVSLSQRGDSFPFLRFADDLWLERARGIRGWISLLPHLNIMKCYFDQGVIFLRKLTFIWVGCLFGGNADLLLSWSFRMANFFGASGLSACSFESLHFPLILLFSCSLIFVYRSSINVKFIVTELKLKFIVKNLVFLLLNSRCLFSCPWRDRILIYGNASLLEERLILFTVRTRIDSTEIPHVIVFPFELLLLLIVLRFIWFHRTDRRIVRTISNE